VISPTTVTKFSSFRPSNLAITHSIRYRYYDTRYPPSRARVQLVVYNLHHTQFAFWKVNERYFYRNSTPLPPYRMRETVSPSLDSPPLQQKTSAHVLFSSEKPSVIDIPSVRTSMVDLLFYTEAEICKMKYEVFLEEEGGAFGTLTSSGKDMFKVDIIIVEDEREEQVTPTTTTNNMDRQDKNDSSATRQSRVREHRARGSSRDRASRSPNRSDRSPNPASPPRRENSPFHKSGLPALFLMTR
jgi:hypothetical protein